LNGEFYLAATASSPERPETKKRNELVPWKFPLTRHARASAAEGFASIYPVNDDIQKTPNDEAKDEENGCEQ